METVSLKIAIQKSGRLSESSIDLLRKCDVGFENGTGKLKAVARNFPVEILFLRSNDIPEYIEDGVADVGIVGENVLAEKNSNIRLVEKLGFGRCRLSIAAPRGSAYRTIKDLDGRRIATSYPNTLRKFLAHNSIDAEIHTISGSVEIAPSIGLADGICDLVSSGSTLFTNGLQELTTVMQSEAVLVANNKLEGGLPRILESLLFRVRAVIAARQNKYILLNAPNDKLDEIGRLLPGIKSPTVMPLATKGWSSVHSVVNQKDYWEVVEKLKSAGAEGVLVIEMEQMIR